MSSVALHILSTYKINLFSHITYTLCYRYINFTVMIDKNIKRFCEVIFEIKTINKELDKEREDFYYGGYSFEECNEYKIKELVDLQNELKGLLKEILVV